jgi:hypothetical protein
LNTKGPKRITTWTSGAIGRLMLACEPALWLAGTFARVNANLEDRTGSSDHEG